MDNIKNFKSIIVDATKLARGLMVVGMSTSDSKQHLVEKGFLPQVAQLACRHAEHDLGGRRSHD